MENIVAAPDAVILGAHFYGDGNRFHRTCCPWSPWRSGSTLSDCALGECQLFFASRNLGDRTPFRFAGCRVANCRNSHCGAVMEWRALSWEAQACRSYFVRHRTNLARNDVYFAASHPGLGSEVAYSVPAYWQPAWRG